jgi:hypothetical protein
MDLDDGIEHLHCGHCGALDDLEEIDFKIEEIDFKIEEITTNPMKAVRTLCARCRKWILEWI